MNHYYYFGILFPKSNDKNQGSMLHSISVQVHLWSCKVAPSVQYPPQRH